MGIYSVVLILTLVVATGNLIVLALVLGSGTPVGSVAGIPVSAGGSGTGSATILLGLLGFVVLILAIIAWVDWRSGIKGLQWEASAMGQAHSLEVDRASSGYSRAVLFFILALVGGVVLAIVIIAQVFGAVVQVTTNSTTASPTAVLQTISPIIRWDLIVGGFILGLFQFLVTFFAAQSLSKAIRSLAKPDEQGRMEEGRMLMVIGGLSPFSAVALAFTPYAVAGSIVGPLIVLFGILRLRRAYGAYLGITPPL